MTVIKRFKRSLTAMIMLFVLISACFFSSFGAGYAKADRFDDETDGLYYFSDSEHCNEYYDTLIGAVPSFVNNRLYYWPQNDFISNLHSFDFYSVKNVHVIIEMNTANPDVFVLDDIFDILKNNGCKIMFINGKDEDLLTPYTYFLTKADIHANTDLFRLFVINVIGKVVEFNGGTQQLEDVTFFLNACFENDTKNTLFGSIFLYYFIPFIRSAYMSDIKSDGLTVRELFRVKNIKIIVHMSNDIYYDFTSNSFFKCDTTEQLYYEILDNIHIYTIGADWLGEDYNSCWVDLIGELMNVSYGTIKNFMYYIGDSSSSANIDNLYCCYQETGMLIYVMLAFCKDGDLEVYNNWKGMCDITYKDIGIGEDGWMHAISDLCIDSWIWSDFVKELLGEEDYAIICHQGFGE